jgi:hypothetical protein
MKYRELLQRLKNLTHEQLDMDVTVCCCDGDSGDEFFPVYAILQTGTECDILDNNHPYFVYYK